MSCGSGGNEDGKGDRCGEPGLACGEMIGGVCGCDCGRDMVGVRKGFVDDVLARVEGAGIEEGRKGLLIEPDDRFPGVEESSDGDGLITACRLCSIELRIYLRI